MPICKKCENKERGMFSGQGFRTFICALCGGEDVWPNTNVPKFCYECSKRLDMCQRCGVPWMRSKRKSVDTHFEIRCLQRLGYIPKKQDLVRAIQNSELTFVERQSNRVTRWLWVDPIYNVECILPYDKERKQIITVLFKEVEDGKEN